MSHPLHARRLTLFRFMLAVLLAVFFPSSAWAVNAFINSGGSSNVNSPTPIAIGQTLTITGHCDKGVLESRETSYLWLSKPGSPANHKLGTYYTADQLDHVRASFTVGALPFTKDVGAVFKVQLACRGGSNGFADRYYRVMPAPKPPTVEPFGIWQDGWINEKTVEITANVTDAGSGVGKVWIKWTGEDADNIEMTKMPRGYYQHTVDLSGMQDGVKNVQIWAETPSHDNNGWQPAGWFTLDRTPPALSNGSIDDRLHQAVVRIHAADNLTGVRSVEVQWEARSGRWQQADMQLDRATGDYLYTIDKDGLRSGDIAVQIRASDGTGNEGDWVSSGSITVNHPVPTIAWDEHNAKFAKETMHVRANVAAGSGFSIAETWIWWNGAPQEGYRMTRQPDGSFTYDIPTEGMAENVPQNVMFWAKDNGGATTSWLTPDGASFTVDNAAPSIQWDAANAAYTKGSITIKTNVSDAGSGLKDVWITWTGERSKTVKMIHGSGTQYSYAIPALPDGVKEVQIWAADNIGNATGWVKKGSYIVDNTAPTINWLTPLDQAMLISDSMRVAGNLVEQNPDHVTIEWQAEDETLWQSHIEKMKAGSNDFEYDLPGLKQGVNYRLRMQATDKAGNVSTMTPARTVIGQLPANVLFTASQLAVLEDSLVDKDHSGDVSRGDDLIYAIELQAGKFAATGLSLRYALPDGLSMTPHTRPYFSSASAMTDGAQLNTHWDGIGDVQLLADDVELAANSKLILHLPVTITGFPAASPLVSTVLAGARNAKDTLRMEHQLVLQDKFPTNGALDLEFTSLQPDWKYRRGVAFDYRIALRARAWDLSNVELRYALPAGLERNGAVRIEGDGAGAMNLNPAWDENGAALLLSSAPGVPLAVLHSFNVIIPVKIALDTAPGSAIQSEIEAKASNLRSPATATHRIVLSDVTDPEEQLVLTKTVDHKTALPGQTLRYTITYTNVGIDDVHDLVIRDAFQSAYLTLGNAQCGPEKPHALRCDFAVGSAPGELEWHLDGKLESGDFGSVSYDVKVNRR